MTIPRRILTGFPQILSAISGGLLAESHLKVLREYATEWPQENVQQLLRAIREVELPLDSKSLEEILKIFEILSQRIAELDVAELERQRQEAIDHLGRGFVGNIVPEMTPVGSNAALFYLGRTTTCKAWPFKTVTPAMVLAEMPQAIGVLTSEQAAMAVCDHVGDLPWADVSVASAIIEFVRDLLIAATEYESFRAATITDEEALLDYMVAAMALLVDDFGSSQPSLTPEAVAAVQALRAKLGESETMDEALVSMLDD